MPNTDINDYAYLSEKIIELIMSKNHEFFNVFMEKILHILPRIANGSLTLSHDDDKLQYSNYDTLTSL